MIDARMRLPMVAASESEREAVRAALSEHGMPVAGGAR